MSVIQATVLLLICFLTAVACTTFPIILTRKSSRRRVSDYTPGDNSKEFGIGLNSKDEEGEYKASADLSQSQASNELQGHKRLYYKLHNLENFPDILPECGELLVS